MLLSRPDALAAGWVGGTGALSASAPVAGRQLEGAGKSRARGSSVLWHCVSLLLLHVTSERIAVLLLLLLLLLLLILLILLPLLVFLQLLLLVRQRHRCLAGVFVATMPHVSAAT